VTANVFTHALSTNAVMARRVREVMIVATHSLILMGNQSLQFSDKLNDLKDLYRNGMVQNSRPDFFSIFGFRSKLL
jgi:hypothetical protein